VSEPVEQELEAIREEARRLDDAITRNEISIGEGGPVLLGHLRRMIEIDLETLQVIVALREWAVRCCVDDWANEISPLNAWDDFTAGLDQFVREFAWRSTNISHAVWFRQFYDARPIDWDILPMLAQVAATVTSVSREGANADYWVLEHRHWDAWTVREAANVTEHNHNTIEYCLRQNAELFKRVVSWEEVDQHDGRGYLRYSEAGLSEAPMSESDAVLMDFEPKQHHSDCEGTTVDTDRDPSENLLYPSKGAGLANRLFQLAARGKDSATRGTDEDVFANAVAEASRLSAAVDNREASIMVTGPALLGCFRRMLEIAPSNVVHLTDTRGWARDRSMHDWAAFNDDLHDWDDFKAGLDQLTQEFS
jgi:hypothetical protein